MTSKEALNYLNDIAHGRAMDLDPQELKEIIIKDLDILEELTKHLIIIYGWRADIKFIRELKLYMDRNMMSDNLVKKLEKELEK